MNQAISWWHCTLSNIELQSCGNVSCCSLINQAVLCVKARADWKFHLFLLTKKFHWTFAQIVFHPAYSSTSSFSCFLKHLTFLATFLGHRGENIIATWTQSIREATSGILVGSDWLLDWLLSHVWRCYRSSISPLSRSIYRKWTAKVNVSWMHGL